MIKAYLYVILFFWSSLSQAQVRDSFADNNLTNNPVWLGDTSKWMLEIGQLKSNSIIVSDTFCLSTPFVAGANNQWALFVNLQFQTSSNNYTDVFLVSDSANLKSITNKAYFVRIGNTKDEVSLYRRVNGNDGVLIDGTDGTINTANNIIQLKVLYDSTGLWTLKTDFTGTGANYQLEGTTNDSLHTNGAYFGILVKQSTASFHQKHYYDNVYAGPIVLDTIKPFIDSVVVKSATQLTVYFSEWVDESTAQNTSNYLCNLGIGNPLSVIRDASNFNRIHATFSTTFTDATTYSLSVNNIKDLEENTLDSTSITFTYIAPEKANFKDVIINEIMADPSPAVQLPEVEFVEFYNRSNKTLNLEGWQLQDASTNSTAILSTSNLTPGEYILLCKATDTTFLSSYGNVMGTPNFPSLNNSGDQLILKDSSGTIIDSLSYSNTWYQDNIKKEGGVSLELINPNSSINCAAFTNWVASNHTQGGTPGIQNSVLITDVTSPTISQLSLYNDSSLTLYFNEAMDSSTSNKATNYIANFSLGSPASAIINTATFSSVQLTYPYPFTPGTRYTLSVSDNLKDCAGNNSKNASATFLLPQQAAENDIVINEVLFNPKEGGVDFVEVYNRSNKIIDLSTIRLSNYDAINNAPINMVNISATSYLFYPQQYALLSTNGALVQQHYYSSNPDAFIDINTLPSFNNASGTVCLSTDSMVIDLFKYNEEMHYALLLDNEGVSLERIHFDRPTSDNTNWHSAAAAVDYATPAYENSQLSIAASSDNPISVSPEIFSPDEDGMDDVLNINYNFNESGYTANVYVYDSKGGLVRQLINNELIGTTGTFSWDGITADKQKARIGIYLIYVEVFALDGTVNKYKTTCVLGGKLN